MPLPKIIDLSVVSTSPTLFTVSFTDVVGAAKYDVAVCAGTSISKVIMRPTIYGGGEHYSIEYAGLLPSQVATIGVRAQFANGTNSAPWAEQTITMMPLPPSTAVSQAQVNAMLAFMVSQVGKPYISVNPTRFGPGAYDCSGLLWAAAQSAGVQLPQSQATADVEVGWFASQSGAELVKNIADLQAGDIVGCTGASPDPVTIDGVLYQIGHIGMMTNSLSLVSALNEQLGVALENVNYMDMVIAVRPQA